MCAYPLSMPFCPSFFPISPTITPGMGRRVFGSRICTNHRKQQTATQNNFVQTPRDRAMGFLHIAAGGECVLQKRGLIGDGVFVDAAREGSRDEITLDPPGGPKCNDKCLRRDRSEWREERPRRDGGRARRVWPQPRDSGGTLRLPEAGRTLPRASSRTAALSPPGCGLLAARPGENNAWSFKALAYSNLFYSSCWKTNPGAGQHSRPEDVGEHTCALQREDFLILTR